MSPRVSEPEAEALRVAYQKLLDDASTDDADLDRIWGAVTGELSPAARRDVVEEVARHPSWALAWRLAHELASAAAESKQPRAVVSGRRWSTLPLLALAAGVVVALGLGFLLRSSPRGSEYREPVAATIESRTPGDAISKRNGCRLEWAGPAGAVFELRMTSEDLGRVHTAAGLAAGAYRVPPEFLAELPPGSRLLWQVEARLAGGGRLASATFVATHEKECRS